MKRLQLPGMGNKPAPHGDRNRLIAMVALFIVFFGAFIALRSNLARRSTGDERGRYLAQEVAPPLDRVPAARVDPQQLAAVADGTRTEQIIREPEPYTHLLGEARKLTPGDLEALGLKPIDFEALARDPKAHRGQPFEVKGRLERIDVDKGDRFQEIRGWLVEPGGRRAAFTVTRESAVQVGDVVRLQGFFFKLAAIEISPGEYADGVPFLIGRQLTRAFLDLPPIQELADVPLYECTDYDVRDLVDLQEDILYYLLAWVRGLTPERAAELEVSDVSWSDLRREPDRWRGKAVRLLGRYADGLEWQRTLGPDGENPLGTRVFYDGILVCQGDRPVRWIGFDRIPDAALVDSKLMTVTGVFFKNYAWENGKKQLMQGPVLVPLRFDPYVIPPNKAMEQIGYIVAGMTGLMVLIFVISVFRDKKSSEAWRRDFLRRKKRSLERSLKQAAAPPDASATASK